MENLKNILKKANVISDLKLFAKDEAGIPRTTGPHTVKLIGDKIIKGTDFDTKKDIYLIRLFLEEDGEKKKYDFPMKDKKGDIHYLVERLAGFSEGSTIVLEGKNQGGRSFTDVHSVDTVTGLPEKELPIVNQDDIPVVEEEPVAQPPLAPPKQESDDSEINVEDIPF